MRTVSAALAASLALAAPLSVHAQDDASAVLRRASAAMGANDLKTLRYTGAGTGASYGQAFKPDTRWPKLNIPSFRRQIDYGSGGTGSSAQLAAELFKDMAGVELREIPYKGAGPALTAVVTGEAALVFGNALTVRPHIQSGRIRALGIASAQRSVAAPELPTIAESGLPGYRADAILGMLAPAKTPRPVVELLNAEVHKAMRSPELAERMKGLGVDVVLTTPEEFGRVIESEMQRWGKLIRKLGLKVER